MSELEKLLAAREAAHEARTRQLVRDVVTKYAADLKRDGEALIAGGDPKGAFVIALGAIALKVADPTNPDAAKYLDDAAKVSGLKPAEVAEIESLK